MSQPQQPITVSASLRGNLAFLWSHWRHFLPHMLAIVLLCASNAFLFMAVPLLMRRIMGQIEHLTSPQEFNRSAWLLTLVGFGLFLNHALVMGYRGRMNDRLGWSFRQRAFEHILTLGRRFLSRVTTGDVVTRLTDDINEKLAWFACSGIFRAIEAVFVITACLSMMIRLSPNLTLVTAGWMPALILIFVAVSTLLQSRYRKLQAAVSEVNAYLESTFSGIRVVQVFADREQFLRSYEARVQQRRQREIEAIRIQALFDSLYQNFWQLGVVLVLLFGGGKVISGELEIADLVAFDTYVVFLVYPMYDLGNFLVRGRQAGVSMTRLREVEAQPPELPPSPPSAQRGPVRGELDLVGVGMESGERRILSSIDLHVAAGERLALAGAIGAGKSSLLRLLARLTDPDSGEVRLDGTPYPHWDRESFRSALALVSQQPVLFSGSIEDNIRFGRAHISREQALHAADLAQLSADLAEFPDGLDTIVGHRGLTLSGGQKQRLALARALAGQPNVLLLDDCTSALDAATEAQLWRQLAEFLPGTTCLLATHRPATLASADRVLFLAHGQLVALGPHAKLLREVPAYAALYGAQE